MDCTKPPKCTDLFEDFYKKNTNVIPKYNTQMIPKNCLKISFGIKGTNACLQITVYLHRYAKSFFNSIFN